jgi:hypothetical protein
MRTIITLNKKQGLFRPRATITVELERWEKDLLPSNVGLNFSASVEIAYHDIDAPLLSVDGQDHHGYSANPHIKYDQKGKWTWSAFLPWKPGKLTVEDYPELEKLAQHIQSRVAKTLIDAIESVETKHTKELPPPEDYKQKAAAYKFAALAKEG